METVKFVVKIVNLYFLRSWYFRLPFGQLWLLDPKLNVHLVENPKVRPGYKNWMKAWRCFRNPSCRLLIGSQPCKLAGKPEAFAFGLHAKLGNRYCKRLTNHHFIWETSVSYSSCGLAVCLQDSADMTLEAPQLKQNKEDLWTLGVLVMPCFAHPTV